MKWLACEMQEPKPGPLEHWKMPSENYLLPIPVAAYYQRDGELGKTRLYLSDGVTVAQGPLEAFVMVRIHVGQPNSNHVCVCAVDGEV